MKKGFTLIELLVVIAIIGILTSVVIASISCARAKGAYLQRTGVSADSCDTARETIKKPLYR